MVESFPRAATMVDTTDGEEKLRWGLRLGLKTKTKLRQRPHYGLGGRFRFRQIKRAAHLHVPPAIYFCEVELEGLDVRGLEALGSFGHFEFNSLAIIQRLIAISHDRRKMYEYIFAALALDESKALAGIKPLHCSLFFTHCVTLFCQPITAEHY